MAKQVILFVIVIGSLIGLAVYNNESRADTSGTIGMTFSDTALIYGKELRIGDREAFIPATSGLFCGISRFAAIDKFIWTGYSVNGGVVLKVNSYPGLWGMSCISTGAARAAVIYSYPYFNKSSKANEDLLNDTDEAAPSDLLEELKAAVNQS